jgi:hypothetical protein
MGVISTSLSSLMGRIKISFRENLQICPRPIGFSPFWSRSSDPTGQTGAARKTVPPLVKQVDKPKQKEEV